MKNQMRKIWNVIMCLMLVAAVFVVAMPVNVNSEEPENPGLPEEPELPEEPGMMGEGEWWIEGNGTYFELTNSTYLNVILTSSEQVYIYLESVPKVVSYHIEADCIATITEITLIGFEVNKNYYRYQNGDLQEEFTTDEAGSYSYTQDISTGHHVFIQETKSTIYIRQDGSLTDEYGNPITPPIDVIGDTYILTDNILESIYIQKSGITLDGDGFSITGPGSFGIYINDETDVIITNVVVSTFSYGINYQYSSYCTINGSIIKDTYCGIELKAPGIYWSNSITVSNNTILDSRTGILVYGSNNIVINNTVSGGQYGIYLLKIGQNNVIDNTVTDNSAWGIALMQSSNNILRDNTMTGNKYNFGVYGISPVHPLSCYEQDIDISNTVDGKPIYYWVSCSYDTIPLDAGYVALVNSNNIIVEGLTLTDNIQGILLSFTTDSKIQNMDVSDNYVGIQFIHSSENTICNNIITESGWKGIYLQGSNSNFVSGNSMTSNRGGPSIELTTSNYCEISSNNIINNRGGIRTSYSHSCTISGNTVSNNQGGIGLSVSNNCIVTGNTVLNNGPGIPVTGIFMQNCQNNFLRDNEIGGNPWDFAVYGDSISHYVHNIDISNTINDKPIYYWVGHEYETVPLDAGYVGIVSSHNITVRDLTITNNRPGVLFVDTYDSVIQNVEVKYNLYGIYLFYSNRNTISGNVAKYNGGGFELVYSDDNYINNNIASSNTVGAWYMYSRSGMRLTSSDNNIMTDNEINSNFIFGIYVEGWSNTISSNTMIANRNYGIRIYEGGENTAFRNSFSNSLGAISVEQSQSNLIYHNNIFITLDESSDTDPSNNHWHHPDLLEGNYWIDYSGVDDGSGTEKHAIVGDRIGDTLIPHPDTDYDFYPFTEPDAWLNAPPIANAGGPYEDYEGTEITFDASLSSDPDDDPLQYRWDFNNDGTWDTDWSDSPTAPYTWFDDHGGVVKVEITDETLTDTAEADVTVLNADPIITSITSPFDPTRVSSPVEISCEFTDPGILDTHTALIDWGDETTSPGTVIEVDGSGTATGSHIYENPGVYTVTMTIFDDDDGETSVTTEYVVIYDPTGAFVTGGGMIESPPGAIPHQPEITGKAGFGFVSKYQKGASTPGGNTQFRFHAGDINFQSDSYEWLVVAGPKAMFKGTGTINGEGNYGFLISAIDGDMPGGGGVDRFRIKIWDKATGEIVYDNGLGAPEDADPASPLTHGSIKIHKG